MSEQKSELQKREVLRLSNEASNQLTRECLQTALLLLLEKKPLEKITITELVARSGVSRSAFYRNYTTKEDILTDICDTIIQKVKSAVEALPTTDKYTWFKDLFQLIKENASNIPLLLKTDFLKIFFEKESLLDTVFLNLSIEDHYRSVAVAGGFTNIMFHWLKNGMKESVDEISKLCFDIFNELQLKRFM